MQRQDEIQHCSVTEWMFGHFLSGAVRLPNREGDNEVKESISERVKIYSSWPFLSVNIEHKDH